MKKFAKSICFLVIVMITAAGCGNLIPAASPEVDPETGEAAGQSRATSSETGSHEGFYYTLWTDGVGWVNYNNGPGGNYSIQWSDCGSFFGGKGWSQGRDNRVISFQGSFNPDGNAYLGVYGWLRNPLVEYYVIENFGTWEPPGSTLAGTIESNEGTYKIYRTQVYNKPSINGIATFYRYWSVRTSKRTSGTVTMQNHFNAWADQGWTIGDHDYQIFATEGYQSSGNSNITVGEITYEDPDDDQQNGNSIIVRARGTSGTEQIRLSAGVNAIQTWTLSTNMESYAVATSNTGELKVEFINDAGGRDVQIDYLSFNGQIRQAEEQSANTSVYQYGSCGGSYSEWMHCNGYIIFTNPDDTQEDEDDSSDWGWGWWWW